MGKQGADRKLKWSAHYKVTVCIGLDQQWFSTGIDYTLFFLSLYIFVMKTITPYFAKMIIKSLRLRKFQKKMRLVLVKTLRKQGKTNVGLLDKEKGIAIVWEQSGWQPLLLFGE